MLYQTTYQPRSPLSQFIEFFWFREGDHLAQYQSRLLPIGSMELVINLHEDRIPLFDRHRAECGSTNGTMICGVHSKGFIIRIDSKISVIGVHFKPGGSASFLALPARELCNQISLEELWQGRAAELRDSFATRTCSLDCSTYSRKPLSDLGALFVEGDAVARSRNHATEASSSCG